MNNSIFVAIVIKFSIFIILSFAFSMGIHAWVVNNEIEYHQMMHDLVYVAIYVLVLMIISVVLWLYSRDIVKHQEHYIFFNLGLILMSLLLLITEIANLFIYIKIVADEPIELLGSILNGGVGVFVALSLLFCVKIKTC